MTGKNFFEFEKNGEIFSLTLKANCHGFRRGDVLTCRKTAGPMSDKAIAVLERDDIGRWPMPYGDIGAEVAAGAVLIGQALCLSRDLDREGGQLGHE